MNREFYRKIGRKGGLKCLKQYGRDYFSKIAGRQKCGIALLQKYGKSYFSILARKSGKKRLKEKGKEWFRQTSKLGIKKLQEKYGKNVFSILGQRGALALFQSYKKEDIIKTLVQKSLEATARYEFNGQKFRSKLEMKIAEFLTKYNMPFKYEIKIGGFYPDFLLPSSKIIEVCATVRKGYVERVKRKVRTFTQLGFEVIIYTTYKLAKDLKRTLSNLPNVKIITTLASLRDLVV